MQSKGSLLLLCQGLYFQTGMSTKFYYTLCLLERAVFSHHCFAKQRTHVCKHRLCVIHMVLLQVLSQPSTWLILTGPHFKHHCSSQRARGILAHEDCSFAESPERSDKTQNNIHLEWKAPFFFTEHLPVQRIFLGWEEARVAYEICTSKHSL